MIDLLGWFAYQLGQFAALPRLILDTASAGPGWRPV